MSKAFITVSSDAIAPMVHWIRHEKVMLDSDLAELYGVPTKALNQAVKRNLERFPEDFMFQLSEDEAERVRSSRSQIVTLKRGQNIKYKYDQQFAVVFDAIKQLIAEDAARKSRPRRRIGFHP